MQKAAGVEGGVAAEPKKLELVSDGRDTSVTLILTDQGHTLGNALRYMLVKVRAPLRRKAAGARARH